MFEELRIASGSPAETTAIGCSLGRLLEPGDIVCLEGDLGAGKTCLARGIADGLGADPAEVSSPTFTLAQEYSGRIPVYHLDLYRLASTDDVEDAGLHEYIGGDGVAIIEWPGVYARLESMHRLVVEIANRHGDDTRELRITAHGDRLSSILKEMKFC